MPRKPLMPGELGTPSLTRVSKQDGGKYRADPKGKHWEARVRVGQTSGQPRLIRRTAPTKQQALDATLNAAKAYSNSGAAPFAKTVTLQQLWESHTATPQWQTLSPYTRRSYSNAQAFSHQTQPSLWERPLEQHLTTSPWEQHFTLLAERHGTAVAKAAKNAIRRLLSPLRTRINILPFREAHVPTGIRVFNTGNQPDRVFTKEELKKLRESLLSQAGNLENFTQKAAALLYVNTYLGLRVGELQRLDPGNLTDDGTVLVARSNKTGTDYPPKPLPQWVQEMFTRLEAARTEATFYGGKERTFAAACTRIFNRAGFPWASSHTIRRTVGGIVFDQKGARVAANWLAHRNVQTTLRHYVKPGSDVGDEPLTF